MRNHPSIPICLVIVNTKPIKKITKPMKKYNGHTRANMMSTTKHINTMIGVGSNTFSLLPFRNLWMALSNPCL
jgi:hypothetical protein